MSDAISYGPIDSDAQLDQLAAISAQALQYPVELSVPYYDLAGRENVRAAWLDGELAGGMVHLPTEQFWGGRPVAMTGIAAVGIAPQHRSRGVGAAMMVESIRELHARGAALASLYPATMPIYRKAGYEVAGYSCEWRLHTDAITEREPSARVRPIMPGDAPLVADLYRDWAAGQPGNLARSPFFWERIRNRRGVTRLGYLIERAGSVEGYFYYAQKSAGTWPYSLEVADWVTTTPTATRRLLQFLGDHRSMASEATWTGPPNDSTLLLLREQSPKVSCKIYWMLRIVDVRRALEARGYPPGMTAQVRLMIRDEDIPGNTGEFLLALNDGRGQVAALTAAQTPASKMDFASSLQQRPPAGSGAVAGASAAQPYAGAAASDVFAADGSKLELDIRALASLYSGFQSAEALCAAGRLRGPAALQRVASAIFAGATPWMRDAF